MRHCIFIGGMTLSRDERDDKNWLYNEDDEGIGLTPENEAEIEQLLQDFFDKHF